MSNADSWLVVSLLTALAGCSGTPTVPTAPAPTEATGDTGSVVVDNDGDGWPADVDCNDDHPFVYPGVDVAPDRRCQNDDGDCDGIEDGREDRDGDGQDWCDNDCDDLDPARFTSAPDPLDGIDQNCDGTDGIGELPTLLEVGTLPAYGLGGTLLAADVNGDGCDDLVYTQSGFVSSVGSAQVFGLLHARLGCTNPVSTVSFEDASAFSQGIGQNMRVWRRGTTDLVVAQTRHSPPGGAVELIDFSSDPPRLVFEMDGVDFGDLYGAVVVHREQAELVAGDLSTGSSGPGRGWMLPQTGEPQPELANPDREWWPFYDDLHLGWVLRAYDRDGDGLEELMTSSAWTTPPEAQAGELHFMSEPGLENAGETWLGDIADGALFGISSYPAPDLPMAGDRGVLAGASGLLDTGALYLLPPVGPGVHTLDEADSLFIGEFQQEWFGGDAAVGDVNGDGHPDVVIGASFDPTITDKYIGPPGKVFVFLGPITEPVLSRGNARVFVGTQPSEHFGRSIELADLDGDGTPEIYVGAPSHGETDVQFPLHDGALYRIDL